MADKVRYYRHLILSLLVTAYWCVVVFALLTYGAVVPTALSVSSLAIFVVLPIAAISLGIPVTARVVIILSVVILSVASLWIVQQSIQLPEALKAHPVWGVVNKILATDVRPTISITPGDTMQGLLKLALPFGVFIMSLIIFDTDVRAVKALKQLAVGTGILAIATIVQFLAVPDFLLFGEKRFYLDSFTGVFVNRNTAATFFGLAVLLQVCLFWRALGRLQRFSLLAWLEGKGASNHKRQTRDVALYGLLTVVCISALLITRSRAGVACTFVSMAVFVVLTTTIQTSKQKQRLADERRRFNRLRRFLTTLSLLGLLTAGFAILSGQLLLRAQIRSINEDDRLCFMPGIRRMIEDSWPSGAGLTSFRYAFPAYRDPACGMVGIFDKAHNFYLEGVFSTGMLFPPLCMAVILTLLVSFGKGIRQRQRFRFAGVLGISALILVATHSLVDFSLQIPGLAVYFAAQMGLVTGICLRRTGFNMPRKDGEDLRGANPTPNTTRGART